MEKLIQWLTECQSTNTYLKELSQEQTLPTGYTIATLLQTRGRGQKGKTWYSEPGMNLTFSTYLNQLNLPIQYSFALNILVSKALHKVVTDILKPITNPSALKIKWPNDLYFADSKLSGMLIESGVAGTNIQSCVAGIGLNLNQTDFAGLKASSLKLITEQDFNLEHCLDLIHQELIKIPSELQGLDNIAELYTQYALSLYRFGQQTNFILNQNGSQFSAVIVGIETSGKLKLRTESGVKSFNLSQISMVI